MSDAEVDDILGNLNKPKKIKSGKKGKRVELELCKVLNSRFSKLFFEHPDWGQFSRSIGSGNRWGQNVHLPKHAQDTFGGDVTCPSNFNFVLESKGGYNEIDLNSAFEGGVSLLDDFLEQVSKEAERTQRKPMLIWKKDRKPRLVFLQTVDVPEIKLDYVLKYRNWTAFNFEELLKLDDSFFFQM